MYYLVYIYGLLGVFEQKKNKLFFISFVLVLAILTFFRYGVGPDYFSYNYLYERLNINPIHELKYGLDPQEKLFRFLGSILKRIGLSYQQYLVSIASVNLYFIAKICWDHSRKPFMSLFLYYSFFYFVWTFSGLRQGLTITIGMYYFLKFNNKNKKIRFIIVTIILSQIHYSVLILIPLYYLANINWSKKGFIKLSFFSIMWSLLPVGRVVSLFSNIVVVNRIAPYVNTDYSIIDAFDFQSLVRIIFLVLGIWYYDELARVNYKSVTIMNTYILSMNIYFLLKFSEATAARLSIYGFYLLILILPNIISIYKSKKNKLFIQLLIILLSIFYFAKESTNMIGNLENSNSSFYVPYTNIYNKENYIYNNRYINLE